ncbi:hypothetical protein RHGRI_017908 [Rhododendron griersonianum]|uniref:THIF-type NAD/FAD binding fold domain-containing protein n=1 Tax=Rhododendron griersonianum TaxID=479676 RepID=A0AAV6JZK9_9ERIC|nr:hypothetical protein RHGRI_017908 [Rhododendron griersonianum]
MTSPPPLSSSSGYCSTSSPFYPIMLPQSLPLPLLPILRNLHPWSGYSDSYSTVFFFQLSTAHFVVVTVVVPTVVMAAAAAVVVDMGVLEGSVEWKAEMGLRDLGLVERDCEEGRRGWVWDKGLVAGERIWGEQGQAALEKASICLLNCGPTGSETLKNLVLGGIGSITVIDGSKVEVGDLGNNFMVDESSVGESKAKTVCTFLQELNDAVKAKFIEEYPKALIETNPSFFSQFTLVVATQLVEDSMVKLERICREANVMLIFARSYGLTGFIRICVKEHTVIESKPDHFLDDLRLNNPWPELRSFAETIDLNVPDPVVHKHTPYVVILVKMAAEWAQTHGGRLPSTREEKKEFKELIRARMRAFDEDNYKEGMDASFKVFAARGISSNLQRILSDSCADVDSNSSDFWVMVAALKDFIDREGEAPLEGSIPDMTSSTELYVTLQKIYQAKAEADFFAIEQNVGNILKKIGRDPDSISKAVIKSFCKNARKLTVCRYRPLEDEFNSPVLPELQKYLTDEDYRHVMRCCMTLEIDYN